VGARAHHQPLRPGARGGVQRSSRHKSGVAMRFPRVARIRWDKPAREADRLESLEALVGERKQT